MTERVSVQIKFPLPRANGKIFPSENMRERKHWQKYMSQTGSDTSFSKLKQLKAHFVHEKSKKFVFKMVVDPKFIIDTT